MSTSKAAYLISDVNMGDAYYAQVDFGLAGFPSGSLQYYKIDIFTSGSNYISHGIFGSGATYYVGASIGIT